MNEKKIADVLKNLKQEVKTGGIELAISSISFFKGIGVKISFSSSSIFIKDKDVDFTATVRDPFFATYLLAVYNNYGSFKIGHEDGLTINGIQFDKSDTEDYEDEASLDPIVSFSPEQFKKLEKDFEITVNNYFKKPALTDVIVFGIKDGSLYEICPGTMLYKLGNFDATVDSVSLEQLYGHTTCACTLPHIYYNFLKDVNEKVDVTIDYDHSRIKLSAGDIIIEYHTYFLSTTLFNNQVKWLSQISNGISVKSFRDIIKFSKEISEVNSDDDLEIEIKMKNTSADCSILEHDFYFDGFDNSENDDFEMKLGPNTSVLGYLSDKLSDKAIFSRVLGIDESRLFIKDGDTLYSMFDSDYE